jgi:hypothetical protein
MAVAISFEERQRFRQPLIFIILVLLLGLSIWGIVQQIFLGQDFGNNPAPDFVLILFAMIPVLLFMFFIFLQQYTFINSEFIDVVISPFGRRRIRWENVEKAYIRDYNPLIEYGGWGIRYGFGGKGVAYSVGGGRQGLQLVLNSGQKILIGTKKGEELKNFIENQGLSTPEN